MSSFQLRTTDRPGQMGAHSGWSSSERWCAPVTEMQARKLAADLPSRPRVSFSASGHRPGSCKWPGGFWKEARQPHLPCSLPLPSAQDPWGALNKLGGALGVEALLGASWFALGYKGS